MHLQAAYICDSHPGLVLQKMREMVLPDEQDLPVDPARDRPKKPCPKCGSTEYTGEEDVLDTWMDSSISVLNVTGWNGCGIPPISPPDQAPGP